MKIGQVDASDVFEGQWITKSADGVEKRFAHDKEKDADAWTQQTAKSAPAPAAAPKPPGLTLDQVWRKVEDVVSNIFPDGDPIDYLAPWLEKQGIRDFKIGDTLDAAAKKNGYTDIYTYYDSMKDLYSKDMTEGSHENTIRAMADARGPDPVPGDTIRTKKMSMEGRVERVGKNRAGYDEVFFRTGDGRLMKTPTSNVTVVQKLEDQDLTEISNDLLTKYKTASGQAASAADKRGDYATGNKRFSGIIKATKKQFSNDAKKTTTEGSYFIDAELKDRAHQLLNNLGDADMDYDEVIELLTANNIPDHIAHEVAIDMGRIPEGSMGGINRSAPAADVSYEKVLNDEQINELNVDTLKSYAQKTKNPRSTDRLGQVVKHARGHEHAIQKIAVKTGDRTPRQAGSRTYEERLAEFVEMDEDKKDVANQFADILGKQDQEQKAAAPKGKVVSIPYHGWEIRYRKAVTPGEKINWKIFDKNGEEKHSGVSMDERGAVGDAEDWIKSGGGTSQQASSKVTIDFNVNFAREFVPGGETFYAMFGDSNGSPGIYISTEPQQGFKKSAIRTQRDKATGTTTLLPVISLSPGEANKVGLKPNARYILGDKDPQDANTDFFPLIYQSTSQSKTDSVKLGKPGLTVATSRNVDEEYRGPWQGDAEKNVKAPKTTMRGSGDVRFSDMVKDTIDTHGLKYAFDYYVKKNGLPPRQFQIFAGLTANKPAAKPQPAPVEQPKAPEKQSWWKKLRGKFPFEE